MTNQGRWISVRRARLRPVALILLVVLTVEACTRWTMSSQPVPAVVHNNPDMRLRVTRGNYTVQEITHAKIAGDTLKGVLKETNADIAIPLSDIRAVEIKETDFAKTMWLIVGLGIGAIILAAALTPDPPPPPPRQPGDSLISCPLVYAWDGTNWRLDSGTFGGAIMRALQRTDVDNLEFATPADGVLRLKVANELNETDYVDALHVVAVDHDAALSVAPDANGKIHAFGALSAPVRATDFGGHDALARIQAVDGWSWVSAAAGRDSARLADVRDGLVLSFIRPANAQHAHLVLDGNNTPWAAKLLGQFVTAHGTGTQAWYDSLNAHPAQAAAMGQQFAREAFLNASVQTGDTWTPAGLFWEAGPEVSKRQALDLDLSKVRGDTVRVRLETVPMFWFIDRVGIDYTADRPVTTTDLTLASARDRHDVDVRSLIERIDDTYYALEPGDAAELHYAVPAVRPGLTRTFLLRSTGWYHVNTPVTAEPDTRILQQIMQPFGISRVAVGRLNDALERVNRSYR